MFSEEAGGVCLGASSWLLLKSLRLALSRQQRIRELPNSQPRHSQISPLKILIPYLQVILSAPLVLVNNTGPGLSLAPRPGVAGCLCMKLRLGVELLQAPGVAVVLNIILISLCVFSGHGA